jgi:HEAT repeat protein/beta-lactamase regulating signal transducer with metallopeptidase domain
MSDRLLFLLFDLSVKAALLAVLAELLVRALRVQAAAARHAVWTVVLGSLFVLAPLSPVSRGLSIPLLPASTVPTAAAAPAAVQIPVPRAAHSSGSVETAAVESMAESLPQAPAAVVQVSWPWQRWLALFYLLGAGLMLSRLCLGLYLSRRLIRNSRELTEPDLHSVCSRLCALAGLRETPRLLVSSQTRVPLTGGCWRPWIVLPKDWRTWSPSKLESVLAHELAHIHRSDGWTRLLVSVLQSVYWFHPAIWLAASRISKLAEEACDTLAVRWTGSRIGYARHLLEVASRLQGSPTRIALAALPMAKRSDVGQRIEAIIGEHPETSRALAPKGPVIATLLAFVLVAAAFHLEPKAAGAAATGKTAAQIQDLSSPDPQVRAQAAVDLRQGGAVVAEAIPALVRLLGDRASVRAIVDDNEQPLGVLTLARTTPGEEASKTLGYYGSIAVDPLLQALGSGRAETRLDAATALGRTRSPRAVQPLSAALGDPSAGVRHMAAWALGTIGDASALDAVTRATKDEDEEVRNMASWAQTKLKLAEPPKGGTSAETLRTDLDHKDYRVRQNAVHALGASADPRTLDALLEALNDSYYGVRLEAAVALSRSEDPRARKALLGALNKDSDYRIRAQAVEALGQRRDSTSVSALRGALKDTDYRVRLKAAAKLARWGEGEGLDALRDGLRHEHQQVRMLSAMGMGETANPSVLDPLSRALRDQDHRVRRVAAEALGELGNRNAIAPLTHALEDENAEVRDAARKALERLNGATQGDHAL